MEVWETFQRISKDFRDVSGVFQGVYCSLRGFRRSNGISGALSGVLGVFQGVSGHFEGVAGIFMIFRGSSRTFLWVSESIRKFAFWNSLKPDKLWNWQALGNSLRSYHKSLLKTPEIPLVCLKTPLKHPWNLFECFLKLLKPLEKLPWKPTKIPLNPSICLDTPWNFLERFLYSRASLHPFCKDVLTNSCGFFSIAFSDFSIDESFWLRNVTWDL